MNLALATFIAAGFVIAAVFMRERPQPTWWQCAWCRKWFNDHGVIQDGAPDGQLEKTSHGCCRVCADKIRI